MAKGCSVDVASSSENRAVKRIPCNTIGPLHLRAASIAVSFLAEIRNVSIQGIAVITNQPYALGMKFVIESGRSGKRVPTALTATIHHVAALPDGRWLCGCSFSRCLTLDDFAAFD
jgi:hypothetical protein